MEEIESVDLQLATLSQISDELRRRFPDRAVIIAVVRASRDHVNGRLTFFTSGSLIEQLGVLDALQVDIRKQWGELEDSDFDEGN